MQRSEVIESLIEMFPQVNRRRVENIVNESETTDDAVLRVLVNSEEKD